MEQIHNDIGGGSSSSAPSSKQSTIASELSKKIMTNFGCDKRIPNDTAEAVSEVLRMFVIEARARASIEAECDLEGAMDEENDDNNATSAMVSIRADHITKIAAEMLMDFS
jgi:hypothetical protein